MARRPGESITPSRATLMPTDLELFFILTCQLVGVAVFVESTGALLAVRQFQDGGVHAADFVSRRGRHHHAVLILPAALRKTLDHPGPLLIFGVRLVAGTVLLVEPTSVPVRTATLWVLCFAGIAQQLRSHTTSGAESHLRTMIAVLALAHVSPGSARLQETALWFIAGHLALVYAVNGWTKLNRSSWRDGSIMRVLARDAVFGNTWLEQVVTRHPGAARAASSVTVLMQCAFPLALVTGTPGATIFVLWGLSFHSANAVLFGLAPFLFSFPAAYPALLFVSGRVVGWA